MTPTTRNPKVKRLWKHPHYSPNSIYFSATHMIQTLHIGFVLRLAPLMAPISSASRQNKIQREKLLSLCFLRQGKRPPKFPNVSFSQLPLPSDVPDISLARMMSHGHTYTHPWVKKKDHHDWSTPISTHLWGWSKSRIVQAQGPTWVLLEKRKVRLPTVYAAEIYKPMKLSTRSNRNL